MIILQIGTTFLLKHCGPIGCLKRSEAGTAPFSFIYCHDAIIPMEVTVKSLRVAQHHNLTLEDYALAMSQEVEKLDKMRLAALDYLQVQMNIVPKLQYIVKSFSCVGSKIQNM